jgi:hypothetical protein
MYSLVLCECVIDFPPEAKGITEILTTTEEPDYPLIEDEDLGGCIRLNPVHTVEKTEGHPNRYRIVAVDDSSMNNDYLSGWLVDLIFTKYEKLEELEPIDIKFTFKYAYKGQFNLEFYPAMLRKMALMQSEMFTHGFRT